MPTSANFTALSCSVVAAALLVEVKAPSEYRGYTKYVIIVQCDCCSVGEIPNVALISKAFGWSTGVGSVTGISRLS